MLAGAAAAEAIDAGMSTEDALAAGAKVIEGTGDSYSLALLDGEKRNVKTWYIGDESLGIASKDGEDPSAKQLQQYISDTLTSEAFNEMIKTKYGNPEARYAAQQVIDTDKAAQGTGVSEEGDEKDKAAPATENQTTAGMNNTRIMLGELDEAVSEIVVDRMDGQMEGGFKLKFTDNTGKIKEDKDLTGEATMAKVKDKKESDDGCLVM